MIEPREKLFPHLAHKACKFTPGLEKQVLAVNFLEGKIAIQFEFSSIFLTSVYYFNVFILEHEMKAYSL